MFEFVVCSPYLKCMQTALQLLKAYESRLENEVGAGSRHKIIVDPALARHPSKHGVAESYITFDEAIEAEADLDERLITYAPTTVPPAKETVEQTNDRIGKALMTAVSRGNNALLVCHGDCVSRVLEMVGQTVQRLPTCSYVHCEAVGKLPANRQLKHISTKAFRVRKSSVASIGNGGASSSTSSCSKSDRGMPSLPFPFSPKGSVGSFSDLKSGASLRTGPVESLGGVTGSREFPGRSSRRSSIGTGDLWSKADLRRLIDSKWDGAVT